MDFEIIKMSQFTYTKWIALFLAWIASLTKRVLRNFPVAFFKQNLINFYFLQLLRDETNMACRYFAAVFLLSYHTFYEIRKLIATKIYAVYLSKSSLRTILQEQILTLVELEQIFNMLMKI